jgi:glycerol kinase
VVRPRVAETTALGAAFAAGLAAGVWESEEELCDRWVEDRRWEPRMDPAARDRELTRWRAAVARSLGWSE